MFAISLSRPFATLAQALDVREAEKATPRRLLPSRINDRQLSEQLMKDTGLCPEDVAGGPYFDARKPFFMQQNFR